MASPWLYRKVTNFFKTTATDEVLANQYIPEVTYIGVAPYINSRFFEGPQAAMTINPVGRPTSPPVQGSFAVGGIKMYGAQDNGKP